MNRRRFLELSVLAGVAPGPISRVLRAESPHHAPESLPSKLRQPLLRKLLSTPQTGFPILTPTFAAMFTLGSGSIPMVQSESLNDFSAQVSTQSGNGYVLSALTTIQNFNRTWYYAAFKQGSGNYELLQTSDLNDFQQAFTQYQSGYTLVDFNVAWQRGTIYYTGYWLANSPGSNSAGQAMVWGLDFNALVTQSSSLASKGTRMTRVQAYPDKTNTVFAALFAPSNNGYVLYSEPIQTFFTDVTTKFGGNSLSGLSFDPVAGDMVGCWLNKVTPSQFVYNQTWDALMASAQQSSAGGMILTAMTAYPNAPDFDDYFAEFEAPFVEGSSYAVALNGNVIASGGGYARGPNEKANPNTPFTPDSRMNIASVSKAVTGIALEALLLQNPSITLDSPFWPLIQSKVPNLDPSIKVVTLRNLAEMKSGMTQEVGTGPLSPPAGYADIWAWLVSYLSKPLVATPGVTYYYDNTNFTILQGVIDQVSGMDYVAYVTQNVLVPAGVNPTIFSATPDPQNIATLQYSGPQDTRPGNYWGQFGFVAPGGWISSARELIKLLIAIRGTSVLPSATVAEMLNDLIGWDSKIVGNFGTYYEKSGAFTNGLNPPQLLNTTFVRLGEGYDCVLIANSEAPVDVTTQVVNAFEARGVPLASEPSGGPYVTTVVHGASFLPECAPGSYLSIIGRGFPSPATLWDPTTTLPTELNGVQVEAAGQSAYINYAGPTQINFLLPSTIPAGKQNVILTMPQGGLQSAVQINAVAPGLFAYTLNGKSYPAALIAGTPIVVAAVGALSGSTSRPATAADFVELYGTGMGPTNPAAPDGVVFHTSYPAANLAAFKVTIGGKAATVTFAGLVGPGLYQLDIQIPTGLTGGDQPLVLTVSGISAQPNLMLTISA